MAITDIATSFGLPFFIKTFFPGFVASALYSCAVMPNIPDSFLVWASLTMGIKLILLVILAIMIGMVMTSLDLFIYQFFEGINWLNPVWLWKFERIKRQFEKIDNDLKDVDDNIGEIQEKYLFNISIYAGLADSLNKNKNLISRLEGEFKTKGFSLSKDVNITKKKEGKWMITDKEKEPIYIVWKEDEKLNIYNGKKEQTEEDEKKLLKLYKKSQKLLVEVRKFPYNPDEGFYSKRYPEQATIFGNVLAEYETYSEKQYGMHMMVFWSHLWLILPKELKKDLDLRGANADLPIYLSFIFLIYTFIGGVGFYFQQNTWVNILTYDIPIGAIICFFLSIGLCFSFYQISIQAHVSYGRYIKAVFDLYRVDLAKKLGTNIIVTNLIPSNTEIEYWLKYRKYLLDYYKKN